MKENMPYSLHNPFTKCGIVDPEWFILHQYVCKFHAMPDDALASGAPLTEIKDG